MGADRGTESAFQERELSSWELRLFDGVRMVSAEERAAMAGASHSPSVEGASVNEPHWYGQRLSGTADAHRDA